jgi:transposase
MNRYDESFKRSALELLARSDRTLSRVAIDLGIAPASLRAWYARAEMAKKGKLPAAKGKRPSGVMSNSDPPTDKERIAQLEREVAVLRKKNDELEMDLAILKKAAAFFAKESE